jgi:ribosomal-protein-alanine N-acetyltransferase
MDIRPGRMEDIPSIAEIFMSSFADSVLYVFGDETPNPKGIEDLLGFVYECEAESFFVAEDAPDILGYIITPTSMRRIWFQAIIRGRIFKWAVRWFRGEYGVGWGSVKRIIKNKIGFILTPYNYTHLEDAQILSIAVVEDMRGHGIGTKLLEKGLGYLKEQGVKEVKLEVRPWNASARAMYKKMGFQETGATCDSQGEWIVMIYSV